MEFLLILFSTLAGIIILLILCEVAYFFFLLLQGLNKAIDQDVPGFHLPFFQQDKYPQEEKEDGTKPLDQFTPDFSKPVRIKIKNEPEGTIVEEEDES